MITLPSPVPGKRRCAKAVVVICLTYANMPNVPLQPGWPNAAPWVAQPAVDDVRGVYDLVQGDDGNG